MLDVQGRARVPQVLGAEHVAALLRLDARLPHCGVEDPVAPVATAHRPTLRRRTGSRRAPVRSSRWPTPRTARGLLAQPGGHRHAAVDYYSVFYGERFCYPSLCLPDLFGESVELGEVLLRGGPSPGASGARRCVSSLSRSSGAMLMPSRFSSSSVGMTPTGVSRPLTSPFFSCSSHSSGRRLSRYPGHRKWPSCRVALEPVDVREDRFVLGRADDLQVVRRRSRPRRRP